MTKYPDPKEQQEPLVSPPIANLIILGALFAILILVVKITDIETVSAAPKTPDVIVQRQVDDDPATAEDGGQEDSSPVDPDASMDAMVPPAPPDPYANWQYTGKAELNDVDIQNLRRALPLLDSEYRLKPDYDSAAFNIWMYDCFRYADKQLRSCIRTGLSSMVPLDEVLADCDREIAPSILEDDEVAKLDAKNADIIEETYLALADSAGD